METFPIPGFCEYQLVTIPHEALREEISLVKNRFSRQFAAAVTGDKIQATFLKFRQFESSEKQIIRKLKTSVAGNDSFKIELRDFGSRPTHTIFINIISRKYVEGLVKQLRTDTQRFLKPDESNKPFFITEPNITIARNISALEFETAWLQFQHSQFTGRFIVKELLLMKRRDGEKIYRQIERFPLLGEKNETTQAHLFD